MTMHLNFSNQEELLAIKKYIISLLVKQALSDDEFSLVEKKYLKHVGTNLELSDVDLAAIIHHPDKYIISPPPDELKRLTILYYLLFMMKVDQNISVEEERLCYKIGLRLGFREELVTNLIKVMKDYLNEKIPPTAMIEKVKPFLN